MKKYFKKENRGGGWNKNGGVSFGVEPPPRCASWLSGMQISSHYFIVISCWNPLAILERGEYGALNIEHAAAPNESNKTINDSELTGPHRLVLNSYVVHLMRIHNMNTICVRSLDTSKRDVVNGDTSHSQFRLSPLIINTENWTEDELFSWKRLN